MVSSGAPSVVLPPIPPALTHRQGSRGVVFTVLVVLGVVLGAGVFALVVVTSGQRDALAVGFALALLPVGPLIAAYLWLDRYEPEPVRLLAMSFAWGALVATTAALVLQTVDAEVNPDTTVIRSAVLLAPLSEEAGKGLFVVLLLWLRRHSIDGVLDGLVYAGLVGIGFAFTENVLYYAGAYAGELGLGEGGLGSATALFIVRGVFSPFAHPLFTSAIGIGVGIMVSSRRRRIRWLAPLVGYAVAVLLHAAWNGSAFIADGRFFLLTYFFAMVPGFLFLVGLALWFRVREGRMLERSLTDLARHGYVRFEEVPWLVRLPARRTARRNARLRGGPVAERVMKDYQHQAIELAVLHDRVLRGVAPPGSRERGTAMAQRLAVLRAHVMLPQHAAYSVLPQHHRQGWG